MDRTIARLNIEHYRRLLARELDEAERRVVERLLSDEETKLVTQEDWKPEAKGRP